MAERTEVAIVGAGPAGVSSAIYLQRAGVRLVLIEKDEPGGLLRNANLVENYPGFPEGIRGTELADLFDRQLKRLGVRVTRARVTSITSNGPGFTINAGGARIKSDAVIVATGTRPIRLGVPGEARLVDRTVFYNIVDLPIGATRSKDIVVVGGGDAAFDYALNLHDRGHKVEIVSRSAPRCLGILQRRADEAGIRVVTGAEVRAIRETSGGFALSCSTADGPTTMSGNLLLVACGREPETRLFERSALKGTRTRNGGPMTDVEGLYLAGDVIRGRERQTGIAVGDGIRAAMLVDELIAERRSRG